jgi:hypothetical protein
LQLIQIVTAERKSMRKRWMKIKRLVVTGSLMVALTISLAVAQVSSFQVTIPFPFAVRNQTLPAGAYVVQRFLGKPKSSADVRVIVMKSKDQHVYKVFVTGSRDESRVVGAARSRLIFINFRGREYLNRICVAGDTVVQQLANVPPEIAAQGATGEVIVPGLVKSREK